MPYDQGGKYVFMDMMSDKRFDRITCFRKSHVLHDNTSVLKSVLRTPYMVEGWETLLQVSLSFLAAINRLKLHNVLPYAKALILRNITEVPPCNVIYMKSRKASMFEGLSHLTELRDSTSINNQTSERDYKLHDKRRSRRIHSN